MNKIDVNNFNKEKLNIYNYRTKNKDTNTIDALKYAYDLTKKETFIAKNAKIKKKSPKEYLIKMNYFYKNLNTKLYD